MIKVYHSANIDAINWKIYVDNMDNVISYFPINTSPIDVTNKLCQCSLFDLDEKEKIYVVYLDGWKLTESQTKECIRELHSISTPIIFVIEATSVKNKIFSELKIEATKVNSVTKKAKMQLIHQLLEKANIRLDSVVEQEFIDLMPDKIDFIRNEIQKLSLMDQKTFTSSEIKQIVFDLGDATVFNIADSWLKSDKHQTIERLNDLISKNVTIQAFVPVFALKLIQIKFYLMARLAHWSVDTITTKQSIPFWQQKQYSDLKPYDQKLEMINNMLIHLYEFDINVKKQKNIPYTQLIKILFK